MSWRRHAFLVRQANPTARLRLVRASLGLVAAISVATLPPAEFLRSHRSDLRSLGHAGDGLPSGMYGPIKGAAVVLNLAVAGSGSTRLALLASATTAAASHESADLYRRLWTYDTHVPALLLLASVPVSGNTVDRAQRASVILTLMQAVVGCVYGQAALAKVRNGRQAWWGTGGTLRGSVAIMGTPAARRLLKHPGLFPALSAGAVLLEAAIPVAAMSGRRGQRVAGAAGLAFHVGTAVSLRIPFWHLAALLPSLFIWRNGPEVKSHPSPRLAVSDRTRRAR